MEAGQSRQRLLFRTGAEAVAGIEDRVTGSRAVRDPSSAEGRALVGERAASMAAGRLVAGPRTPPVLPRGTSCLHHVESVPGAVGLGVFELVAGSAQEAVDLSLAGHLLSQRLGRPGLLSLSPALAEALAPVRIPDDEVIAASLVASSADDPVDPYDPERVVALAAECLAHVAACTGRAAALVTREDFGSADWAVVAAGGALDAARAAVAALAEAGVPGRLVSPRLVRPLPGGELAETLAGVRRVFVVEQVPGRSPLRAAVRSALPPRVAVAAVEAEDAEALIRSLAAALAPELRGARAPALPAPAPLPNRLIAAPDGPWARALVQDVLGALADDGAVRADRRVRGHLGAAVLAWGSADDTGAGGAEAPVEARDVLVVSGPSLLEPDGALALLRGGGHLLVSVEAPNERALARRIPTPVRSFLLDRGLHCHWIAERSTADRARDAGDAADADRREDAEAARRLRAAAGWLAAGAADESERPAGLRTLATAALQAAQATEEVDFRPHHAGLRWPASEVDESRRARWAARLEAFHHETVADHASPLRPAVRPALLVALQRDMAADPAHPFVVVVHEGDEPAGAVETRPLAALIDAGLGEITSAGRDPRALEHARRALLHEAARLLARGSGSMDARPLLLKAGDTVRRTLRLPDADGNALEEDLAALVETVPAHARAYDWQAETPVQLYMAVVAATRAPARRRLRGELAHLRDHLRTLLQVDELSSERGRSPESLAAHLGSGAGDLIDADALARTLPEASASGRLDPSRRARIEWASSAIEHFLVEDDAAPRPALLHPPELALSHVPARTVAHDDPLSAAVGYFDGVAEQGAVLCRAVRTARLEISGRYDPARHDAALARLGWEAMTADELSLLRPVAVVTTGRRLRRRGQAALSELLRSSRPVHVLVLDEVAVEDEAQDASLYHLDLGQLVMAHREAFALSSTGARPEHFVSGLARMSRAPRPGVALVHLPGRAFGPLRSLLAEAALWGRACPDFLYDPDAGPSWADRFDVDGNPQPDQAWPRRTLPAWRARADGDEQEQALEVGFTFADAVALEPAYQRHLMVLPAAAWDDTRQQPLSDWLEALDGSADLHGIPYVWAVDDDGVVQRAAVTRALALISRDRLRAWHALQELAGFENAHVERAVAAAAEAARLEAEQARTALERAHADALARAREEGARASLHRLAETLVRGDARAALLATTGDRPEAVADHPRARQEETAGPTDAPVHGPSDAPDDAGSATDTDEAPAEAEEEPLLEEPWVDSALCTTCNECTNLNGRLFAYNADKQATIADASAGTYEELVRAAEKCPARCIHPGSPRPGDETATPELLARAQAFR